MNPSCHSNGYSENGLDFSKEVFNNQPGSWRAWKKPDGKGVKSSEATIETEEFKFWLYRHGDGACPSITIGSFLRPGKNGRPQTVYYISKITPTQGPESTFTLSWDEEKQKVVRGGNNVVWFKPTCNRLLLAQNVRVVGGALDFSRASIAWYAPQKIIAFDPGEDTDLRPYLSPRTSVKDAEWPPFQSPEYADWRFNPKRAGEVGDYDDIVSVPQYVKWAIKEGLTPQEVFPNSDFKPAVGFEQWWGDSTSFIMLYGISCVKDETDGKKAVSPLYWNKVSMGAGDFKDGEPIDSQISREALWLRLQGYPVYGVGAPPFFRVPVDQDGRAHNFFADIDPSCAFDLRLFCSRYEWVSRVLVDDPRHPGEKMIDRTVPKARGYFNTKCWASVRQIAPVLPRALA